MDAQAFPNSCFIIAGEKADRFVRTVNPFQSWADEVILVDRGGFDETMAGLWTTKALCQAAANDR